jgi:arginine/ornithine permease
MAFASLSLLTYKFAKETVYVWLLSIAGITAVLAWMSIALSQYFFRKKYLAEGGKVEDLKYRTPFYPFLPLLTFALNAIILVSLAFDKETMPSLTIGIPVMIACYLIYYVVYGRKTKKNA